MDERGIPERHKNGNVLEPREPTFAIVVGQENEIVTMKYVSLALRSWSRRPSDCIWTATKEWYVVFDFKRDDLCLMPFFCPP